MNSRARMRRTARRPRLRALHLPRQRPWLKVIKGDCLQVLRSLPTSSFDLVATDPPYGVTDNDWDSAPCLVEWWNEIDRITKPAAVVAICCQQPFTTDLIASCRKNWRYELIWHKSLATGFLWSRRYPLRAHEHVQVFCRRICSSTYNPQMTPGKPYRSKGRSRQSSNWGAFGIKPTISNGLRFPRSVLNIACARRRGEHPTQKPVELMEWIVKTYTHPGDAVLDCYMGSGTTGVACVLHGRSFLGIESNARYFRTANRRIADAGRARVSRAMRDS